MKKKIILFTFLDTKSFWENPVFKKQADAIVETICKKFEMDEDGKIVLSFIDPTRLIKARCITGLDLEEEFFGKKENKKSTELSDKISTFANAYVSSALFMIDETWTECKNNKDVVIVIEDENKFSLDPYLVSIEVSFSAHVELLAKHCPGSIFMLSEVLKV